MSEAAFSRRIWPRADGSRPVSFDDIKRQGRETYQSRMADIIGLGGRKHEYVLKLSDSELETARHIWSAWA